MTERRFKPAPDPEKDALERRGSYIVCGALLLTEYEWNCGAKPDDNELAKRRQELEGKKQIVELRAQAPIRAKVDQADMSDTPLFGQGTLL